MGSHLFLELFIAARYLRAQGSTALFSSGMRLSFLFMSLMVFIMTLVLSVFNGFEQEIHKLLARSGAHITVRSSYPGSAIKDHMAILSSFATDPELNDLMRASYPSIAMNALLEIDNRFEGKKVRGIPAPRKGSSPSHFKNYPDIVHYKEKYLKKFNGGNYVLVGRKPAHDYKWKIGNRINLVLPGGGVGPAGMNIRVGTFIIAGFFRTGFLEVDNNVIFMSMKTAQRMLRLGSSAGEIIVQIKDLAQLDRATAMMRRNIPGNPYEYSFTTIRDEKGNFLAAVRLEKTMMMVVMALLIVAGAAGIWATIYMLVSDRKKSIGMLRAMGLPVRSVYLIFTMNALLVGLLSTIVGGSLGIYLTSHMETTIKFIEDAASSVCLSIFGQCEAIRILPDNIYYFDYLPVYPDLNIIFGIGMITLVLSGFAGYFPSRRAATLDPIEAIRMED